MAFVAAVSGALDTDPWKAVDLVFLILFGVLLSRFTHTLVDSVGDCGDHLLVSRDGKFEKIPVQSIVEVDAGYLVNSGRVVLHLSPASSFGQEISFIPQYSLSLTGVGANSIAKELSIRAQAARAMSRPTLPSSGCVPASRVPPLRSTVRRHKPMHANIRLAMKLAVTPAVLAVGFMLFSAGRQAPEVSELSSMPSPDGMLIARLVYTVYVGHLTGDPARHEVYIGSVGERQESQTLVFAAEGGDYKIEWSGVRELRITKSKLAIVQLQQDLARNVSVQYASW